MWCKFEVKCLVCGCTEVKLHCNFDYDWEGMTEIDGYYLECTNCGETEDII